MQDFFHQQRVFNQISAAKGTRDGWICAVLAMLADILRAAFSEALVCFCCACGSMSGECLGCSTWLKPKKSWYLILFTLVYMHMYISLDLDPKKRVQVQQVSPIDMDDHVWEWVFQDWANASKTQTFQTKSQVSGKVLRNCRWHSCIPQHFKLGKKKLPNHCRLLNLYYCWWLKSCTTWYVKTLQIMGEATYQLVQDFSHQQYGPQKKWYPWASPTALRPALPPPRRQLSLAAGAFPLALRAEDTSPQRKSKKNTAETTQETYGSHFFSGLAKNRWTFDLTKKNTW